MRAEQAKINGIRGIIKSLFMEIRVGKDSRVCEWSALRAKLANGFLNSMRIHSICWNWQMHGHDNFGESNFSLVMVILEK